jgi:hypothetical protein
VVEGQLGAGTVVAAILAGEAVAQEDVEAGEGRRRAAGMYSRSAITEGRRRVKEGECTSVSYSLSTETRSSTTAFTASCQAQTESG